MKPVVIETLKNYRLRFFGFSVGVTLYILLVTSVFQNFLTSSSNNLGSSVEQLPDTLRSFISIKGDFLSPAGFLGSEPYYVLLPIVFIILAIGIGSSLIAKEEEKHTIELLLARPISRGKLLAAKALGGGLILLGSNVISLVAMIVFTRVFNMSIDIVYLVEVHLLLLLLSLIFGALALALTAIGHSIKSFAIGLSALLALGGYILASLEQQVSWLAWPSKLLPYHYYDPSSILYGQFDWVVAFWYGVVVVLLALVAWITFRRRDID